MTYVITIYFYITSIFSIIASGASLHEASKNGSSASFISFIGYAISGVIMLYIAIWCTMHIWGVVVL